MIELEGTTGSSPANDRKKGFDDAIKQWLDMQILASQSGDFARDKGRQAAETLLLTNELKRSAAALIGRYAKRMLIENNIEDGVSFFHMDALSSAVALKVNCDLQLTLMASSLYRYLGQRIGHGYETAKSRHLFRDFIDATATIDIGGRGISVHFQKRAHNPLLLAAGFDKTEVRIPWLGNKPLQLVFG